MAALILAGGLSAKNMFTISCAVIGALLIIIRTRQGLNQRRVKLQIIPKIAYPFSRGDDFGPEVVCIEVTNLSGFPVTARDLGFTMKSEARKDAQRATIQPILQDGGPWPRRLETRSSVKLYFPYSDIKRDLDELYVVTDSGKVFHADEAAFRGIKKQF